MATGEKKSIVIRVEPEFHKQLKTFASSEGITLQDYVLQLIENDQKNKEK